LSHERIESHATANEDETRIAKMRLASISMPRNKVGERIVKGVRRALHIRNEDAQSRRNAFVFESQAHRGTATTLSAHDRPARNMRVDRTPPCNIYTPSLHRAEMTAKEACDAALDCNRNPITSRRRTLSNGANIPPKKI
jgi:hypothetical protein